MHTHIDSGAREWMWKSEESLWMLRFLTQIIRLNSKHHYLRTDLASPRSYVYERSKAKREKVVCVEQPLCKWKLEVSQIAEKWGFQRLSGIRKTNTVLYTIGPWLRREGKRRKQSGTRGSGVKQQLGEQRSADNNYRRVGRELKLERC